MTNIKTMEDMYKVMEEATIKERNHSTGILMAASKVKEYASTLTEETHKALCNDIADMLEQHAAKRLNP